MIRVLLVDDHELMRQGLRAILDDDEQVEVAGEASGGRSAVELARKLAPDVVMKDMNGIDATRQIRAECPEVRVLALSSYADRRYVSAILEAGACGYVLKANAYDDLRRAIEAAMEGKSYLCADVTQAVVGASLGEMEFPVDLAAAPLSPREREVLQLLVAALELLVGGLRLFVRRGELLVGGLQLRDAFLEVFPQALELCLELRPLGLRLRGRGLAPAAAGSSGRLRLEGDQQQGAREGSALHPLDGQAQRVGAPFPLQADLPLGARPIALRDLPEGGGEGGAQPLPRHVDDVQVGTARRQLEIGPHATVDLLDLSAEVHHHRWRPEALGQTGAQRLRQVDLGALGARQCGGGGRRGHRPGAPLDGRGRRDVVVAPEEPPALVQSREELPGGPEVLAGAQQEETPRVQAVVERGEQGLLGVGHDVDQEVPARDQIDPGEGGGRAGRPGRRRRCGPAAPS